jgi:hypothetical protein
LHDILRVLAARETSQYMRAKPWQDLVEQRLERLPVSPLRGSHIGSPTGLVFSRRRFARLDTIFGKAALLSHYGRIPLRLRMRVQRARLAHPSRRAAGGGMTIDDTGWTEQFPNPMGAIPRGFPPACLEKRKVVFLSLDRPSALARLFRSTLGLTNLDRPNLPGRASE